MNIYIEGDENILVLWDMFFFEISGVGNGEKSPSYLMVKFTPCIHGGLGHSLILQFLCKLSVRIKTH